MMSIKYTIVLTTLFITLATQADHNFYKLEAYNTNFDWQYYVAHNNLVGIDTEKKAYEHYLNYGKAHSLPYCKSFKMLIVLHLFELSIIDWLIDKTNQFIKNNECNSYAIKITIPIDTNIARFKPTHAHRSPVIPLNVTDVIKKLTPYHSQLVSKKNAPILYGIADYLYDRLDVAKENIQIIFCENRGVDIGGFFLALDQIIKQQLPHDFLVKFHSKLHESRSWFSLFLDLKVNKILNYYDCLYSSDLAIPDHCTNMQYMRKLQKMTRLEHLRTFNFPVGTMFIVSSQFTQFVAQWPFNRYFNMLNKGHNYVFEPYFERLFGCIFEALQLKRYYFAKFPTTTTVDKHFSPSPYIV